VQQHVLEAGGMGADNYGLLTWAQMDALVRAAGLEVFRVDPAGVERQALVLRAFARLARAFRTGLPAAQVEAMVRLMRTDPRFMPGWNLFLRKPALPA
jgi:hypothetical protein